MRKVSLKSLKQRAWKAFSKYVRLTGSKNGLNACISCKREYPWEEMNAGHYIHGKLDYDTINVNVQCVGCNKWKHGNLGEYTIALIKKHGIEAVDALRLRASRAVTEKFSREELLEIAITYEEKVERLLKGKI